MTGKYQCGALLGSGGMGEVFRAVLGGEFGGRPLAIKRIRDAYSGNAEFANQFMHEARLSASLVHPNIVSVFDFDRDETGNLFIAMEIVEGCDLHVLSNTGPLSSVVIAYVISQVLRGLGYAHELRSDDGQRGVVHRDVSPQNVLVSWKGEVKVSDFGIAKARTDVQGGTLTIKGKPAYMSPEQANGENLTAKSDLFSVGVILWELLAGRRLFFGDDAMAVISSVFFMKIPRPSQITSGVPRELERIAMRLLERDLEKRYATAEAVLQDLVTNVGPTPDGRDALRAVMSERLGGGVEPAASLPNYFLPPRAPRRARLTSWLLVVAIGVALVGVMIGALAPASQPEAVAKDDGTRLAVADAVAVPDWKQYTPSCRTLLETAARLSKCDRLPKSTHEGFVKMYPELVTRYRLGTHPALVARTLEDSCRSMSPTFAGYLQVCSQAPAGGLPSRALGPRCKALEAELVKNDVCPDADLVLGSVKAVLASLRKAAAFDVGSRYSDRFSHLFEEACGRYEQGYAAIDPRCISGQPRPSLHETLATVSVDWDIVSLACAPAFLLLAEGATCPNAKENMRAQAQYALRKNMDVTREMVRMGTLNAKQENACLGSLGSMFESFGCSTP